MPVRLTFPEKSIMQLLLIVLLSTGVLSATT